MAAESGNSVRLVITRRGPEIDKNRCETCGEEFSSSRREAKTCSDRCKQKAYRQRRKEVQQNQ